MVKRLRHRPFTAVTRVRFPLESLKSVIFRLTVDYRFVIIKKVNNMAPWPSGKAKVCNTSITSSNLVGASSISRTIVPEIFFSENKK